MFENNTVFILGAGASANYGYPTGERLIDEVLGDGEEILSLLRVPFKFHYVVQSVPRVVEDGYDKSGGLYAARDSWKKRNSECDELIRRIELVRPLFIDYFLA
jgi:hypothetical protein